MSMPPASVPLQRINIIYACYRIALSFFLITLFLLAQNNSILGANDPALYLQTISSYCVATLIGYLLLRYWPIYEDTQLFLMLVIDVTAMTLMLYANGGPSLQLSMLYLVVVMAASILLTQGRAMVIALLAALAVIYQQLYFSLLQGSQLQMASSVGLLAVSFVATSLLGQLITRRLRLVEREAEIQSEHAAQFQAINQHIIQQMHTGILVLDQFQDIMLINDAARQWLHQPDAEKGWTLSQLSTVLDQQINAALSREQFTPFIMVADEKSVALSVQLITLDQTVLNQQIKPMQTAPTVVILENLSRANQQAQQLKLASLGRLTASIAHEIRNPLAAISQAGELLTETITQPEERALLAMIQKQSVRLNRMIEDILQLSRRNTSQPQTIELLGWLNEFCRDFVPNTTERINSQTYSAEQLRIKLLDPEVKQLHVSFDPMQLEQVVTNLVNNGLHHGSKKHDQPKVLFRIKTLESGLVMLDVADQGGGIPAHVASSLFEPFFTTESGGTGLGLYLSRAFCEANGASLWCVPQEKGACFRISFGV